MFFEFFASSSLEKAVRSQVKPDGTYTKTILTHIITLDPIQKIHTRKVYGIVDLIGDLGGVFEILFSIVSIFIQPISYVTFVFQAI